MDLKPGDIKCDKCKGTGYDLKTPTVDDKHYYRKHYPCSKCKGVGKLDWIEQVVGKKTPSYNLNGVTWMPHPTDGPPPDPEVGHAYVNSNTKEVNIYDGNNWVRVDSQATPTPL